MDEATSPFVVASVVDEATSPFVTIQLWNSPLNSARIRRELQQIWQAGIDAVRADRLVQNAVRITDNAIEVAGTSVPLADLDRIVVVGGGKASGHMAAGFEAAIGDSAIEDSPIAKQVNGWVNVPEDCVLPTKYIRLHAARPAGKNEPTYDGIAGSREILKQVAELTDRDLCIVLISGGGSALMPAPVAGTSLKEKQRITQVLSAAGANIHELNTVRRHLSCIKGGGLKKACKAGHLITLIISDVLGDPLDVIASGPTVQGTSSPTDAIAVLEKYKLAETFCNAMHILEMRVKYPAWPHKNPTAEQLQTTAFKTCENHILANNQTALDASADEAKRLGYAVQILPTDNDEPSAEQVATTLVSQLKAAATTREKQSSGTPPLCVLSGGEPTVQLAPEDRRGIGGRNQQLMLMALAELANSKRNLPDAQIGLLSGGSDGEDGPTDAAGAMIWPDLIHAARQSRLAMQHHLASNDAWHFLGPLGALVRTGPTGTNVCDVRVMIVGS